VDGRVKAIRDLAQCPDRDFFHEVAIGLDLVAQNAFAIEDDARHMWGEKRPRGHAVLRALAAEEAAKFLILLDAVRCPRVPSEAFSGQIDRFDKHLPKGIYAQYCDWEPATFAG